VSAQASKNLQNVNPGVLETLTLGLQNVLGRVADNAASVRPYRTPMDAKSGVQETAKNGAPSVVGKAAISALSAKACRSLGNAETGVQETVMIGTQSVGGKTAGDVMHVGGIEDSSTAVHPQWSMFPDKWSSFDREHVAMTWGVTALQIFVLCTCVS